MSETSGWIIDDWPEDLVKAVRDYVEAEHERGVRAREIFRNLIRKSAISTDESPDHWLEKDE